MSSQDQRLVADRKRRVLAPAAPKERIFCKQHKEAIGKQTEAMNQHDEDDESKSTSDEQPILIDGRVRLVKLRQKDVNAKLGFSLRGGKELTGSSVGVFVSHVERQSEADKRGLKIGDQLIQVNGLCVNQATYDEVIGLIKQTPKSSDILLKVVNLGKIPVQEKSGEPIRWLRVADLLEYQQTVTLADTTDKRSASKVKARAPEPPGSSSGGQSLSSDDGIESCESQRALSPSEKLTSSSSSSSSSSASDSQPVISSVSFSSLDGEDEEGEGEGETCGELLSSPAPSACSLSISSACTDTAIGSVGNLTRTTTKITDSRQQAVECQQRREQERVPLVCGHDDDDIETLVSVPGGQRTNEPFGCGVVKGPDEWPGIFVQTVKPNSLAERVGLEPGDQLTRADGEHLVDLSFEVAIGLIKRLQQGQDELVLHVRRGAALRHLACRQRQQQLQLHQCQQVESFVQERGPREEEASVIADEVKLQACFVEENPERAGGALQVNSVTAVGSPKATKAPDAVGRSAGGGTGSNPISGPQSQLSGKQREQRASYNDNANDDNHAESRLAYRDKAARDVNIEMRQWQSESKLEVSKRLTSNQLDRCLASVSPIDRSSAPNHSSGRLSCSTIETTITIPQQRQPNDSPAQTIQTLETTKSMQQHCSSSACDRKQTDLNYKQPVQQSMKRRQQQHLGELREHCEPEEERSELMDGTCEMPTRGVNHNDQESEVGEQIRIVVHDCKLHKHHQPARAQNQRKNFLQDKSTQQASKLQQQPLQPQRQQQQQPKELPKQELIAIRQSKSSALAARKCQIYAQADTRHQFDCGPSIATTLAPSLQRYVSMDNLSPCGANAKRRSRAVPSGRQQATHMRPQSSLQVDGCSYSRRLVGQQQQQQQQKQQKLHYDQVLSVGNRWLYRRSNSLLGQQHTLCCDASLMAPNSSALRYWPDDHNVPKLFSQQQQQYECCKRALQQSQSNYSKSSSRYGNTLAASAFALSRNKAHSVDKLNMMNINLNYVKIGLQQQRLRGQQVANSKLLNSHNKSRSTHLLFGANELCCQAHVEQPLACTIEAPPTIKLTANRAMPQLYNYATASGLISNSSAEVVVPNLLQVRARPEVSRMVLAPNQRQPCNCCSCNISSECPANRTSRYNKQPILVKSPTSLETNTSQQQQDTVSCCSTIYTRAMAARGSSNTLAIPPDTRLTADRQPLYPSSSCYLVRCCPTHQSSPALIRNGALQRASKGPSRTSKYSSLADGTTTDSSGYLSATEPCGSRARLLKICPTSVLVPNPPPLPPPLPTNSVGAVRRDTRQRMTTFLSSGSQSGSHHVGQMAPSSCQQQMASSGSSANVSPSTYSSSNYSPTSSTSSVDSSSLSTTETLLEQTQKHAAICNNSGHNHSHSHSHNHNRQHQSPRRGILVGAVVSELLQPTSAGRHIPCPPPLPASDAEFDNKSVLRQQKQPIVCRKSAGESKTTTTTARGSPVASSRPNRLCFVDELKMLAQRQDQLGGQQTQQQAHLDSSTLIKIINASKTKTNAGREKGCSCHVTNSTTATTTTTTSAVGAITVSETIGRSCAKCKSSQQQQQQQQRGARLASTAHEFPNAANKSVKLTEEDNKRRQHELLMKEFKSAHSRMFRRRKQDTEEQGGQSDSCREEEEDNKVDKAQRAIPKQQASVKLMIENGIQRKHTIAVLT